MNCPVRALSLFLVYAAICTAGAQNEREQNQRPSGGSVDAATRAAAAVIVSRIERADYEADRAGLARLRDELGSFSKDAAIGARIQYWRGFAMWRRAINGFNDSVDPNELEQDLNTALGDFREASAKDPGFIEAKIGTISVLGYLMFLKRADQARVQDAMGQMLPLVKESKAAAPENPRLAWVMGPILWNTPAERGGGQNKAIESYQKALDWCQKNKPAPGDTLEPHWGEPELMMNLAWSYLNRTEPQLDAAEQHARSALQIVPYWHYVRDILLPQIVAARAKLK